MSPRLPTRDPKPALAVPRGSTASSEGDPPTIGSVLKRNYQGQTIEVEVLATGFWYRDQVYGSLSQLAHRITGTRWNGYVFFKTVSVVP